MPYSEDARAIGNYRYDSLVSVVVALSVVGRDSSVVTNFDREQQCKQNYQRQRFSIVFFPSTSPEAGCVNTLFRVYRESLFISLSVVVGDKKGNSVQYYIQPLLRVNW